MSDGTALSLARLSDEDLVERYRSANPSGETNEPTALEEEMRSRGLLPDREKTIPDSASGENGKDSLPA